MEKTQLNIYSLFSGLAQHWAFITQYNEDHFCPTCSGILNANIRDLCKLMTDSKKGDSPIQRYAQTNQFVQERMSPDDTCMEVDYDRTAAFMKNISWAGETADFS